MREPTDLISIGSFQGWPINLLLLLGGISVIDARQLLPITLGSCAMLVVPRGNKKVVMSYVELR